MFENANYRFKKLLTLKNRGIKAMNLQKKSILSRSQKKNTKMKRSKTVNLEEEVDKKDAKATRLNQGKPASYL